MVVVPGGEFLMGTTDPDSSPHDGEGPVRNVTLSSYRIDATAVTNRQFATFAASTGHVTDAERYGWSYVFHSLVHDHAREHVLPATVPAAPWWVAVAGATWRYPTGPGSDIGNLQNHPVVHVSWNDATAYAQWAGVQLPTEAQWEHAARGGLAQRRYPWGDELTPEGHEMCNIWQGPFPGNGSAPANGTGTVEVTTHPPNAHGLYGCSGNVWEWCADWWSTTWHHPDTPATRVEPAGPGTGTARVVRGGSYLCHDSYCNRYRVGARTRNTPDSSTGHTGFRCVASQPE